MTGEAKRDAEAHRYSSSVTGVDLKFDGAVQKVGAVIAVCHLYMHTACSLGRR